MIRGLYTSANGMLAQSSRMDVIANNLANTNTNGYKSERGTLKSFPEVLASRINNNTSTGRRNIIGSINHGVHIDEISIDFSQGALEYTYNNLDMLIMGNGFFVLQTPEGEMYTRDGAFSLNADGFLISSYGNLVLGQNGPVHLGTNDFYADESGNIYVNNLYMDRLNIVDFEDYSGLRKKGDNLFENINKNTQPAVFQGKLGQGMLEKSNVNPIEEMVNMLSTMRNFEANQRMITLQDSTLDKAINDVGRV